MRWALAVPLLLLLAGCAAPEAPKDPLFGLCPQWVQGPGEQAGSLRLDANASHANVTLFPPGNLTTHLGRPLDLYRLHLESLQLHNGTVKVRAYDGERLLNWRDFRGARVDTVPVLGWADGDAAGNPYEVNLASVLQKDPPSPAPVELRFSLEGAGGAELSYKVTFHYRICGLEA